MCIYVKLQLVYYLKKLKIFNIKTIKMNLKISKIFLKIKSLKFLKNLQILINFLIATILIDIIVYFYLLMQ